MSFYNCPKCSSEQTGPFLGTCPSCDFDISHLTGQFTTDFQIKKWNEHTDIYRGCSISLYGKEYNASFDHNGVASLPDLINFTISYGDRAVLPTRGGKENPIIVSYIPEILGSGTSLYSPGNIASSGMCLISAASNNWGHSHPFLKDWLDHRFGGRSTSCCFCGAETEFAQPLCSKCFCEDWRSLVRAPP